MQLCSSLQSVDTFSGFARGTSTNTPPNYNTLFPCGEKLGRVGVGGSSMSFETGLFATRNGRSKWFWKIYLWYTKCNDRRGWWSKKRSEELKNMRIELKQILPPIAESILKKNTESLAGGRIDRGFWPTGVAEVRGRSLDAEFSCWRRKTGQKVLYSAKLERRKARRLGLLRRQ